MRSRPVFYIVSRRKRMLARTFAHPAGDGPSCQPTSVAESNPPNLGFGRFEICVAFPYKKQANSSLNLLRGALSHPNIKKLRPYAFVTGFLHITPVNRN